MKPDEAAFEEFVATQLLEHGGYAEVNGPRYASPSDFDPVAGIDTADLFAFVGATQADDAVTIHSNRVEASVVTAEQIVGSLEDTRRSGLSTNDEPQDQLVDPQRFLEAGRNRVTLFLPRK
jgi:hypothetical protein